MPPLERQDVPMRKQQTTLSVFNRSTGTVDYERGAKIRPLVAQAMKRLKRRNIMFPKLLHL
jgi:hypothetical protein